MFVINERQFKTQYLRIFSSIHNTCSLSTIIYKDTIEDMKEKILIYLTMELTVSNTIYFNTVVRQMRNLKGKDYFLFLTPFHHI